MNGVLVLAMKLFLSKLTQFPASAAFEQFLFISFHLNRLNDENAFSTQSKRNCRIYVALISNIFINKNKIEMLECAVIYAIHLNNASLWGSLFFVYSFVMRKNEKYKIEIKIERTKKT